MPDLRRNSIGNRIFSRAFSNRTAVESARVPLLLRAFIIQHLCISGRCPGRTARAHRRHKAEGAKVCSRLCYRLGGVELVLPVAGKPSVVAAAVTGGRI